MVTVRYRPGMQPLIVNFSIPAGKTQPQGLLHVQPTYIYHGVSHRSTKLVLRVAPRYFQQRAAAQNNITQEVLFEIRTPTLPHKPLWMRS